MKEPGTLALLFGNPLALLATLAATAFFGFQWASAGASPVPAIVAFLAFCQALNATQQMRKYKDWKREWDAMEGKSRAAASNGGLPNARLLLGVPAWLFGAYLVMTAGDDPGMQFAKVSFWIATAVGVGALVFRNMPGKPQATNAVATRYPDVTVIVAMPLSAPTVAEARAQLPDYCQSLLHGPR